MSASCQRNDKPQVDESVWKRFKWVIPGQLARSSSPNYMSTDADQRMTPEAVSFLHANGITNIISLNKYPLSKKEQDLLSPLITYTHIPVPDFTAPTLDQLQLANSRFIGTTLVYCGYGHGRTGTIISALQLYSGHALTLNDYRANHVETNTQMDVLNQLKWSLERSVSLHVLY